jgi:hypothetical protein
MIDCGRIGPCRTDSEIPGVALEVTDRKRIERRLERRVEDRTTKRRPALLQNFGVR